MSSEISGNSIFKMRDGVRMVQVAPERNERAAAVDADRNGLLDDAEIVDFLRANDDLPPAGFGNVDVQKVVADFKTNLLNEVPEQAAAYSTYDEMAQKLADLETRFPNLCERVSLGRTPEGREIWAVHITAGVKCGDNLDKPGIVFTGAHHAREWMSMEAPLYLANELASGYASDPEMKRRLDSADIWVVPCVNPDGYEYSRTKDSWWRKNRNPVTETGCDKQAPAGTIGVDLNRNYDDGKPEHAYLYRPASDKACRTDDDFGRATSDNPRSDTYRGPRGASEVEVQAMLKLELGRGNIKGIIDHHGYGEMILYPWGHTRDEVANVAEYKRVGNLMNEAMGKKFRVMQSTSLYPTSGSSDDIHHANGIFSFTLEIGKSFQPDRKDIDPIRKQVAAGDLVFLDEVIKMSAPPAQVAPEAPSFLLSGS